MPNVFGGRGLPLYSTQQLMYTQAYGEQWQDQYNEFHDNDNDQEDEHYEDTAADGACSSFEDDHTVNGSAEVVQASSLLSPTATEFKPGCSHVEK